MTTAARGNSSTSFDVNSDPNISSGRALAAYTMSRKTEYRTASPRKREGVERDGSRSGGTVRQFHVDCLVYLLEREERCGADSDCPRPDVVKRKAAGCGRRRAKDGAKIAIRSAPWNRWE